MPWPTVIRQVVMNIRPAPRGSGRGDQGGPDVKVGDEVPGLVGAPSPSPTRIRSSGYALTRR
jgi:hypothetical protein